MKDKYQLTVGLEVHVELKTKTKMFCVCKNDPDEIRPNINICPICMGHPGTLPVINQEAVKFIRIVGSAINGELLPQAEFDRKNYFYPDIPKGYQISQYKFPLVRGGELAGVNITRVHLEEDTAKSTHQGDASLIDFNRAGVPLMELVTEPVIHSGSEMANFAKELQLLLQYLGVAYANMEKGEMRIEANISVSVTNALGTKVEVKNLNSFRSAERAVLFEYERQVSILESEGRVGQETRGWDDVKQVTFSQRNKEDSHDYRYFPDPDLPKVDFDRWEYMSTETIASYVRETPIQKRERYVKDFGIKETDIEFYVNNPDFAALFEEILKELSGKDKQVIQLLSNYIVSDIAGIAADFSTRSAHLAQLICMVSGGEVSSRGAKEIIAHMVSDDRTPKVIAKEKGLLQNSDEGALLDVAKRVLVENPTVVAEYKAGNLSAIQFLIGQGMKISKGSANPAILRKLLEGNI